MLPNFRPDSKQNLHPTVKIFVLTAFSAILTGCFRQSAPDRIPSAETLDACLAATGDLQFAHLSAENGRLETFPDALAGCPALWKLGLRGQTALKPLPAAIGSLRAAVKQTDLVQSGTAEAGAVLFPVKYKSAPVVIATAGTVSNVSSSGFTLSAAAQWIACGR